MLLNSLTQKQFKMNATESSQEIHTHKIIIPVIIK